MSTIRGFRNVSLIDSFRATLKLDPLISGSDSRTSNEKPVGLIRNANSHFHKRSTWHCLELINVLRVFVKSTCSLEFCCPLHLIGALCVALSLCNVCRQITVSELDGRVPDFPLAPVHLTSNQSVTGGSPCVPNFSLTWLMNESLLPTVTLSQTDMVFPECETGEEVEKPLSALI